MSEIASQVLHDSTHRKPALDDFELPVLPFDALRDQTSEKSSIKSHADVPQAAVYTPSKKQINKARLQFITLCWTIFLAGWNDGSTGPLLPRIQEAYKVCFVEDLT